MGSQKGVPAEPGGVRGPPTSLALLQCPPRVIHPPGAGVFRSDLPTKFRCKPEAYQARWVVGCACVWVYLWGLREYGCMRVVCVYRCMGLCVSVPGPVLGARGLHRASDTILLFNQP